MRGEMVLKIGDVVILESDPREWFIKDILVVSMETVYVIECSESKTQEFAHEGELELR